MSGSLPDVLDPRVPVAVCCPPVIYQLLARTWLDQGTARDLLRRQLERERAARQVISMTVITRTELAALVDEVAEFTCPRQPVRLRAGRRVLMATRRARDYLCGGSPGLPAVLEGPVAEDDTPTEVFPAIREVQVP